ncbi:hypothetical protein GCM10018980_33240 [Streptomyces capoamus]|uniref:VWFA domain-containing protein n=1 Tax=Streptomyces capoamus TaxID=68183 RepID=A0A919C4S8_9ACTN|nr:hypothetical protein [Streptomyces capoamus]GGW10043.1 hypothetical protein GCM10010501_03890 [Streptomyces libani subsp. rufus]GHG51086.1 hypothetical protein GCM10018980_33240 [Streptomyces capoamus]
MSVFDDFDEMFAGSADPADDMQFNTESYHRRIVILLIDVSGSMRFAEKGTRPIDELNRSLRAWLPEIREQGRGPLRSVEFAVVTFGGDGVRAVTGDARRPEDELAHDGGVFVLASDLDFDDLTASGTTPMAQALEFALRLGDRRVQYLADRHGLQTGQVRLILFSDGEPNDVHREGRRRAGPREGEGDAQRGRGRGGHVCPLVPRRAGRAGCRGLLPAGRTVSVGGVAETAARRPALQGAVAGR